MKIGKKYLLAIIMLAIVVIGTISAFYYYNIYAPSEQAKNEEIKTWTDWANTLVVATNSLDASASLIEGWGIVGNPISNAISDRIFCSLDPNDIRMQIGESIQTKQLSTGSWVTDVKIRQGLHFQDGENITAFDVKASWDYEKSPNCTNGYASPHNALYGASNNTVVLDNYTLRIYQKGQYSMSTDAMELFGGNAGEVASAKSLERFIAKTPDPTTGIIKDVGSGPFKITEWAQGTKCVLTRWDDYATTGVGGWVSGMGKALPKLEKVIIMQSVDKASLRMALEKGEIDMINAGISRADVVDLMNRTDITVDMATGGGNKRFVLMSWKPPFDNIQVRQAVAYAINSSEIVQRAEAGFPVEIAQSNVRSSIWGFKPYWSQMYNVTDRIDKARQLLVEAGYATGFNTQLWIYNNAGDEGDVATVIQSQLAKIGITVEIKLTELAAFNTALYSGSFGLGLRNWDLPPYSLDYDMCQSQVDSITGSRYIVDGYGTDYKNNCPDWQRLQDLVKLGRELSAKDLSNPHPPELVTVYDELQQRCAADAIAIPLWDEPKYQVYRSYVKNYTRPRSYQDPWWDCWKEIPKDVADRLGIKQTLASASLALPAANAAIKYAQQIQTIPMDPRFVLKREL